MHVAFGFGPLTVEHFKIPSKLGSVVGPVIQANGRLTFEDDLRSGNLVSYNNMTF